MRHPPIRPLHAALGVLFLAIGCGDGASPPPDPGGRESASPARVRPHVAGVEGTGVSGGPASG